MMLICTNVFAGKCGQYIFSKGIWMKYTYAPNTISQNIKKYGSSTTTAYTAETLTGISDPGVTTGAMTSTSQAFTSWGPCSTIDGGLFGAKERREYLKDNFDEIKRHIAQGNGMQLKTLTFIYGCGTTKSRINLFSQRLRQKASQLLNFSSTENIQFDKSIAQGIYTSPELKSACQFES